MTIVYCLLSFLSFYYRDEQFSDVCCFVSENKYLTACRTLNYANQFLVVDDSEFRFERPNRNRMNILFVWVNNILQ